VTLVDFLYEPAVVQGVQEPEAHPFPESRSLDDVP
jgi:hypothetical protein